LLDDGQALAAGSNLEDEGTGLGLVEVKNDLSLGITDGRRSQPGGVEGTSWSVELTDETGPSRNVFLFFREFGFFLNLEVESEHLLSEGELVVVVVLLFIVGVDNLHFASLGVDGWVELIGDDGGVWDLVVGGQVDGSTGSSTAEVGGGDGQFELTLWGLTGNKGEWSLNNDVTLDTSLIFLLSEWTFEGQFTVDFPGIDWRKVSLEGDSGRFALFLELDGSADGDEGGHAHVVDEGESHDGWHGSQVLGHVDGLLVVDVQFTMGVSTLGELLGQFLNGGRVEGPETFNLISQLDIDGGDGGLSLSTAFNVQQVLDFMKILVSLQFLRFSFGDSVDEGVGQLLDSVSGNRDLNGVNSGGSISELEEVSVVDVVGEERVLRLEVGQVLGESRVDFLEEFSSKKVVRPGN